MRLRAGSRDLAAEARGRGTESRPGRAVDREVRTAEASGRRGDRAAALLLVILTATFIPAVVWAQKGRVQVKEGNRLYAQGRFTEAHEKYLDALRDAPDSPLIRFNDGNALYQTEEYQKALEAYGGAIGSGDRELVSQGWYNLGNALYRQQQLRDALEAYKQSLRADPTDVDAKHNLELVLKQLQQQQQGQEGQQQQQDQRQPEQQQPEQQQPEQQQPEQQDRDQQQEQQGGEREQDQQQRDQETPQPQPGQMSREEAERLLQAIQEDPGQLKRQRAPSVTRRRPRKEW